MKRFLLITAAVAAMLMLALPAMAQETGFDNAFFAGGSVTDIIGEKATGAFDYGFGHRITGRLWYYTHAIVGDYGSWTNDAAYFFGNGTLAIGPIAGPDVDWINQTPTEPTAYIAGASGAAFTATFDKWGLWGAAKYKFALESGTLYQNGWVGGAGVFVGF